MKEVVVVKKQKQKKKLVNFSSKNCNYLIIRIISYCNGDTVRNRADTLIKLNGVKVTYGIETEFTEQHHSIHLGMVKITF